LEKKTLLFSGNEKVDGTTPRERMKKTGGLLLSKITGRLPSREARTQDREKTEEGGGEGELRNGLSFEPQPRGKAPKNQKKRRKKREECTR